VPLAMTATRFTAYVHNPRRMPPYTDKVLTDAQLADLFAYIKSMPASPPADQIPLLKRIMEASK
jgi:ubiquinol-cytochrome c reductase cytochrome c subunit